MSDIVDFNSETHDLQPQQSKEEAVSRYQRQKKMETIYKAMLPKLGTNPATLVMVQLMITLKLEGVLTEDLSDKELSMLRTISESVMSNEQRRTKALKLAQRLLY
jgi:hypothetical protein